MLKLGEFKVVEDYLSMELGNFDVILGVQMVADVKRCGDKFEYQDDEN